jgi:sodium transport system permease protein
MRPRGLIVGVIARKELREVLRDRRTLFRMVLVPVLLYPVMLLVVAQVAGSRKASLEQTPSRVLVVVEAAGEATPPPPAQALDALKAHGKLSVVGTQAPGHAEIARRLALGSDPGGLDAAVVIHHWPSDLGDDAAAEVSLHFSSVEDKSLLAAKRLEEALDALGAEMTAARLAAHGLPPSVAAPLKHVRLDRSDPAQRGGKLLGMLLPMFVVVTVMLGAISPAIDLTAGEKERRSLQTLLTAPVGVLEVVLGKYVAVVCVSFLSGVVNIASMALVFGRVGAGLLGASAEVSLGVGTLALMLGFTGLIAALVSALALAVAVAARDFKDAQNMLAPLLMGLMIPSLLIQLPGVELSPMTAMVPVVNALLLLKRALAAQPVEAEAVFLVVASLCATTALALLAAAKVFAQERVMAGERGQFNLLARPSEIAPKPRPSPAEGVGWVAALFVLLFYAGAALQGWHARWGLLATLWLVLALPTVGVARYLKLDLAETFALRAPSARQMGGALALGAGAWVLVAHLQALVEVVMPTPPALYEALQRALPVATTPADWAAMLLVAALSPAICEELVFRGFLLSSLRGRLPAWAAVGASAAAFGAFHMSLYRLAPTMTLGLVMGWLALRSRSVWPAVAFHGVNNAAALGLSAAWLHALGAIPWWLTVAAAASCALGLALTLSSPASADAR